MTPRRPRCTTTHGVVNEPKPYPLMAYKFVNLVKQTKQVYYPFTLILRAYSQHRCNPPARLLSMIERLLNKHSHLREQFIFIKTEIRMFHFNEKIKDRLAKERYLQYVAILHGYRKRQKKMIEVVLEVAELLADHIDLLLEFFACLPDDIPL